MKVGVLGAFGNLGSSLVNCLSTKTDFEIVAGMRHSKVNTFQHSDKVTVKSVEILDNNNLESFVKECDVVANCSSPAYRLSIPVAKACIKEKTPMVDVSGNDELQQYIESQQETLKKLGLTFILSAGVYPGFTEFFPNYILKNENGQSLRMSMYVSCLERLSKNAARDYVRSIKKNNGLGMLYYKENQLKKYENKQIALNPIIEKEAWFQELYPTMNPELVKLARASPELKEMHFYNGYPDKTVLNEMMAIRIHTLCNQTVDENSESEKLHQRFQSMVETYGSGIKIALILYDERLKRERMFAFELQNSEDCISGIVALSSIVSLATGECEKGLVYPYEIMDTNQCMEWLMEKGAQCRQVTL